ncbi:MAG: hypothetical protein WCL39_00745 [Armatimonadota bacterium]
MSTTLVSWHGVGADVPENWNIVAASGDAEEGYFRVDGPLGEIAEFRWKKAKRQPDLELVADDYLKQVKKSTRRQKDLYEGDIFGRGAKSKGRKQAMQSDVTFEWTADRQGWGRLIWCFDCKRTVIAQISAPRGMSVRDEALDILGTLHDHTHDEGVEWGVYGLRYRVPVGVKLIKQRLMSGYLSLNYLGKQGRVIIERWGLAEDLLTKGFLGWHESLYLAELQAFRGDSSPVDWDEHEALQTEGYEGGIARLKSLYRAFFLPGRAEKYASIVWHCPETNRIVGVRAYGKRPLELARSVASTVRCHGL